MAWNRLASGFDVRGMIFWFGTAAATALFSKDGGCVLCVNEK